MADFKFMAFAFIVMAFALDALGIANFWSTNSDKVESVEWAEIGGFVCVTVALLLFVLMKFSDLGGNKPAAVCAMIFAIAAGALILLGLILYNDRYGRNPPPYNSAILVVAAGSAGLAGLFLMLDTCNCKC